MIKTIKKDYTKCCAKCGLKMLIKQINKNTAVCLCPDLNCSYNSPESEWTIIKRTYEDWKHSENHKISSSGKHKRNLVKAAAIADIDQLVDLTYENTCDGVLTTVNNCPPVFSDTIQYSMNNSTPSAQLNHVNVPDIPCKPVDPRHFITESSSVDNNTNSKKNILSIDVSYNLLDTRQLKLDSKTFNLLDAEHSKEVQQNDQFLPVKIENSELLSPKELKFKGFKFTSYTIKPECNQK